MYKILLFNSFWLHEIHLKQIKCGIFFLAQSGNYGIIKKEKKHNLKKISLQVFCWTKTWAFYWQYFNTLWSVARCIIILENYFITKSIFYWCNEKNVQNLTLDTQCTSTGHGAFMMERVHIAGHVQLTSLNNWQGL